MLSTGRIDILCITPHYTYVIELKLTKNGGVAAAEKQIRDNQYLEPFKADKTRQIIGLAIELEDLGKGLRSVTGTMYGTSAKGTRYLEMAEGYVTQLALDCDNEIIGYQFVNLGKMTDFIKKGDDANTAWEKAKGQYGRVDDAVKIIDPRKQ